MRIIFFLCVCIISCSCSNRNIEPARRPNVIIIFTDDQGYQDLGCFGSPNIKTPHIDRLSATGLRLSNFYVAACVCTPSRAALMTGCYPHRVSLDRVLFPWANIGLNPDETTMAEVFKSQGYATACIGKWHLGHHPQFLPTRQGFDSYFGIPYSNDMDKTFEPRRESPEDLDRTWSDLGGSTKRYPVPLFRNETLVERPVNQKTLTDRYTQEAVKFIRDHQHEPFFLYLPHAMPHVPLYVPDERYNSDPKQAYRLVIEHIDQSTGQIIDALKETGLDNNTLVIFTSDNGPWLSKGHHGGSALPLREGKGTSYEGGFRVPCVIWGPGLIAGERVSDEVVTSLDLLPTLGRLIGSPLPANKIDGLDVWPLIRGDEGARSPREVFYYFSTRGQIQAVRCGDLKLRCVEGNVELFDLKNDISESKNLAAARPEDVKRLTQLMDDFSDQIKREKRAPGRLSEEEARQSPFYKPHPNRK